MPGILWSRIKNYLYDKKLIRPATSSSFVISIGNLTWGGTGKTSLSLQLARWLLSLDCRVAVVLRGYHRASKGLQVVNNDSPDWQQFGDEASMLAARVPDALIVVSEDRAKAFRFLEKEKPDVILMDDAFQHRRAGRNVDLLLINASENLLQQRVIPLGKLREPKEAIRRADAIVLTHSRRGNAETMKWVAQNFSGPLFHANYAPVNSADWKGKKLAAFCGIAAPDRFFAMLSEHGATLVCKESFPDHYSYSSKELQRLENQARSAGAEALITTAKDAVRLVTNWLHIPLLTAEVDLVIDEAEAFQSFLRQQLPQRAAAV
jgi:tetraacyldisaccharide 4'-kinase